MSRWIDKYNAAVRDLLAAERALDRADRHAIFPLDDLWDARNTAADALIDLVTKGRCPECGGAMGTMSYGEDGEPPECIECDWTETPHA